MKILFAIFLLLSCCVGVNAQSNQQQKRNDEICAMESKDLPLFRGIALNANYPIPKSTIPIDLFLSDQARDKYPSRKINRVHELGYNYFIYDKNGILPLPENIDVSKVETVRIETFDDKIVGFALSYDETNNWTDIDDLVESFSSALKIPLSAWTIENRGANAKCRDFTAEIIAIKSSKRNVLMFYLHSFGFEDEIIRREIERTKKKSDGFKP
jgi:hypothetical protein